MLAPPSNNFPSLLNLPVAQLSFTAVGYHFCCWWDFGSRRFPKYHRVRIPYEEKIARIIVRATWVPLPDKAGASKLHDTMASRDTEGGVRHNTLGVTWCGE